MKVFHDCRMENMKQKLFLGYRFVSLEIRVLVLLYVTLWNYESFIFLFTSSQLFYVISKSRNSRWGCGICRKILWWLWFLFERKDMILDNLPNILNTENRKFRRYYILFLFGQWNQSKEFSKQLSLSGSKSPSSQKKY